MIDKSFITCENHLKFDDFSGPIWSVIQIENCINKSLADNFINYDEWYHLMSLCSDILKRLTGNEKNS